MKNFWLVKQEPSSYSWSDFVAEGQTSWTGVRNYAARKLDHRIVDRLNAFAVGDCVPDITFVLDVDAATAESRMRQPRAPDRMEQQPAEFYERVREGYRQLAAHDAKRIVLIDASRDVDQVENEIWGMLASRFPALTTNPKS